MGGEHLHSSSLTAINQGKKPFLATVLLPSLKAKPQQKPKSFRSKQNQLSYQEVKSHMDPFSTCLCSSILLILLGGASGATFTFVNNCDYTVWPGILANSGSPKLESTGFELQKATSRSFQAPIGWSGRFWGRTYCNFDESGRGSCVTGDCGSGEVECNGAGAAPPATLAEFTLGSGSQDFYDVSLVDGYNVAMMVEGRGGSGSCAATGCVADLNRQCPTELRVGEGEACKSACEAFGNPEYCCSGAYSTPSTCKPSVYSAMFKSACPRSYSYAYDDATSTFTCTGADYVVTFCPSYANSQKSTDESGTTTDTDGVGVGGDAAAAGGSQVATANGVGSSTTTSTPAGGGGVMLADASWIAGLATGDSTRTAILSTSQYTLAVIVIAAIVVVR